MKIHTVCGKFAGKDSLEILALMDSGNHNLNPEYIEGQLDEYKERVHQGMLDIVQYIIFNLRYTDIEKLLQHGQVVEVLAKNTSPSPKPDAS